MTKYSFDALQNKYGNFISCNGKVDISGFILTDKYQLENLTVSLTALYEASYASFKVCSGLEYNGSAMKLDSSLASKLKTGNSVTISMGYSDSYVEVFKGYIDSVTIEYDELSGFSVSAMCLDAKGLMMNSGRSEIKTGVKKYSDAVKNTLNNYASFISGKSIKVTDELTAPIHQYNESDYQFIVRLAQHINYSFYIVKGKAYFIPLGSDNTELIEINLKTRLIRFSVTKALNKRVNKVIVINNDETDEKKRIKSEVSNIDDLHTGSNRKPNSSSAINSSMVKTIVDTSATTADIAKKVAQAEMDKLSYSTVEGSIELIGLPELVPGQYISVKDFSTEFDKKYYIKKAVHRIFNRKYTTEIEVGGNNL